MTPFQRDRVDLLMQEFVTRFPPFPAQEAESKTEAELKAETTSIKEEQPAEKKMKLNNI